MALLVEGPIVGSSVDGQERLWTYTLVYKVTGLTGATNAKRIDDAILVAGIPDHGDKMSGIGAWVTAKSARMIGSETAEVTVVAIWAWDRPFIEFGTTLVQAITDLDRDGDPMKISYADSTGTEEHQSIRVAKWIPKRVARARVYMEKDPKDIQETVGLIWKGSDRFNSGARPKGFPWLVWSFNSTEIVAGKLWEVVMEFLYEEPLAGETIPFLTRHFLTNPDGSPRLDSAGNPLKTFRQSPVYQHVSGRELDFLK